MPNYRVTDTATGEQFMIRETTDWDAWMHWKGLVNSMRPAERRLNTKRHFKAEGTPGGHHLAVEEIDDAGQVVMGTYITYSSDDAQ